MNILFVTYHTCARVAKEAKALEAAGHQVIILQHVAASEEILYATELASFYRTEQGLLDRISYFGEWSEVIHVHNEPNWIVPVAAAARDVTCPEVPIIFDIHDLESQRENGNIDKHEGSAIHAADAFIFPSKGYEKGIKKVWNVGKVPSRVIYSFCNREDIVTDPLPRVNGLVYEGMTIAPLKGFEANDSGYKRYRDYVELTKQLTKSYVPFHLYGVRKEFHQVYTDAGAIVNEIMRFPDMMRQLSRYDWGLCGHLDNHPQWQKAMPNKLFEYLAAGIPVISINAGEVSEFIKENRFGFVAENIDDLVSYLAMDANLIEENEMSSMREDCTENISKNINKFVMENQVPEIEALYAEAARYRKDRLDAGVPMQHGLRRGADVESWVCFDKPAASA